MMAESSDQQSCAICLEDLWRLRNGSAANVGAVVPCGHCFHESCFRRWKCHTERISSSSSTSSSSSSSSNTLKCQCPMCNSLADNFVKLFVGGNSEDETNKSPPTTAAAATSILPSLESMEDEGLLVLALTCHDSAKRLDCVKDKLFRYKRHNRTLEQQIESDRRHIERLRGEKKEALEKLEKTGEKHAKERRMWRRQQRRQQEELELMKEENRILKESLEKSAEQQQEDERKWKEQQEKMQQELDCSKQDVKRWKEHSSKKLKEHNKDIKNREKKEQVLQQKLLSATQENDLLKTEVDRSVELHIEERRRWEQQLKRIDQELEKSRTRTAKAEDKVQKAAHGIAQMKIYNSKRRDQMDQVVKERDELAKQVHELKALARAAMSEEQESVYFE